MTTSRAKRSQSVIQSVASFFGGRLSQYLMPAKPGLLSATNLPPFATGLRTLDKALSCGGLPRGQLIELISPSATMDSSGTLCLAARLAAKAQRQQEIVTIIDLNHSFDAWLAARAGLMAPELLLSQPDTLFEALTRLEEAARQDGLVLVIMGTVADLLPHVQPQLLKVLLRRLRTIIKQSNAVFLFITSPLEADPFNPANYPPGFSLPELAILRLWVQDEQWTYRDSVATAYKATVTVLKNELAPIGLGATIRIKFSG